MSTIFDPATWVFNKQEIVFGMHDMPYTAHIFRNKSMSESL